MQRVREDLLSRGQSPPTSSPSLYLALTPNYRDRDSMTNSSIACVIGRRPVRRPRRLTLLILKLKSLRKLWTVAGMVTDRRTLHFWSWVRISLIGKVLRFIDQASAWRQSVWLADDEPDVGLTGVVESIFAFEEEPIPQDIPGAGLTTASYKVISCSLKSGQHPWLRSFIQVDALLYFSDVADYVYEGYRRRQCPWQPNPLKEAVSDL